MDEYVDILDAEGHFTGETTLKSVAHRQGLFHPTVHIWFYRTDGKVLMQQRGKHKQTHPLLWDVSVAGHVSAGEDVLEAAVRETEEEIGLRIDKHNLEKIGCFKAVYRHGPQMLDCEYHHTFLYKLDTHLSALTKQDSEVEALEMVPLTQLTEEIWGLARPGKYVPHEIGYYKTVFKAIKARL